MALFADYHLPAFCHQMVKTPLTVRRQSELNRKAIIKWSQNLALLPSQCQIKSEHSRIIFYVENVEQQLFITEYSMPAAQECSQNGPDIYCLFNCYLSLNPVIFFGTNVSLGMSKGRFFGQYSSKIQRGGRTGIACEAVILFDTLVPELQYHMAKRTLASEIPVKRWLIGKNYLEHHQPLLLPRRKDISGGSSWKECLVPGRNGKAVAI